MIDEQLKNKFRIVLEEIISQSVTSRDEVPVLLSGGARCGCVAGQAQGRETAPEARGVD